MIPFPPALLTVAEPPAASLQAWIGADQDPAPFVAFAQARRRDLAAGAREPHRTWLLGLVQKGPEVLRDWAATRLVESQAAPQAGMPSPNALLLDACAERFKRVVIRGNGDTQLEEARREEPPRDWWALGAVGEVAPDAPCWAVWRAQLAQLKAPSVGLGFYALFAPHLEAGDEAWVRAALAAASVNPIKEPLQSLAFLLATDWLLLHGQDAHWKAFQETAAPGAWRDTIADLAKRVRKIPLYWDATAPDAPAHPAGAFTPPKLRRTTFLMPDYPDEAAKLGFSTDARVELQLDPHGTPVRLRLRPGYALAVFGPAALKWVGRWTFEPATLDGAPAPSWFLAKVRFVRKR